MPSCDKHRRIRTATRLLLLLLSKLTISQPICSHIGSVAFLTILIAARSYIRTTGAEFAGFFISDHVFPLWQSSYGPSHSQSCRSRNSVVNNRPVFHRARSPPTSPQAPANARDDAWGSSSDTDFPCLFRTGIAAVGLTGIAGTIEGVTLRTFHLVPASPR